MNKLNGLTLVGMRSLLSVPVLCISVTGCGSMHPERDMAGLLGAYQTKIKTDMEVFALSRDRLAEARHQNIDFLEHSAATTESENNLSLVAWRIAEDKQRLGLQTGFRGAVQDQITKAPSATILLDERREISMDIRAAVKARADKLGESAKILGQLAEPKDFRSEIEFFADFTRQVADSIEKQRAEAEKNAEEGKKKTENVADTTKNTVGTIAQQKNDKAKKPSE